MSGPVEMYFVYAPKCQACEKMKPVIEQFRFKYGDEIYVEAVNIADEFPPLGIRKWTPDKTPTTIFRVGHRVWVMEGAVELEFLEQWIGDIMAQPGVL